MTTIDYQFSSKVVAEITPLPGVSSATQDVIYVEHRAQVGEVPALQVTMQQQTLTYNSTLPGPVSTNQDVTCSEQRMTQERNAAASSRVDSHVPGSYSYSQLKGLAYQESQSYVLFKVTNE